MKRERINELLKIKEFSTGEPFEIIVNNKKHLGILLQYTKLNKNSKVVKENNLDFFAIRATDEDFEPATIERSVLVNRVGYFILDKDELILFDDEGLGDEIKEYNFID